MSIMPITVLGYAIGWVTTLVLMSACTPFKVWDTALTPGPMSTPGGSSTVLIPLLIGKRDLPPKDWKLAIKPHREPEYYGQNRGVYVGFNTDSHSAPVIHVVLQYSSGRDALKGLDRCAEVHFDSAGRQTPWKRPVELDFQGDGADESRLACADFLSIGDDKTHFTRCVAVVVYDEYVSILSADVTDRYEGALSYSEFESVLQAINERMRAELDAA